MRGIVYTNEGVVNTNYAGSYTDTYTQTQIKLTVRDIKLIPIQDPTGYTES